ncbi:MAG: DUF2442 domain-containing protein, partial [Planctomycetota bacterium]
MGGGVGIHWPELDEEISVEGLLAGRRSGETQDSNRSSNSSPTCSSRARRQRKERGRQVPKWPAVHSPHPLHEVVTMPETSPLRVVVCFAPAGRAAWLRRHADKPLDLQGSRTNRNRKDPIMPATQPIVLTLRDRLSRLTHTQACKLLGERGRDLIAAGGKFEINLDEQARLKADRFCLNLDGAEVTITHRPDARGHLRWHCEPCRVACVHVGAAFSLILEEKMALGLAAAPAVEPPLEALAEQELVARALAEREERAKVEKMRVKSSAPAEPWVDYVVTSRVSGKTHRVALRGLERGESYCSCPDFRKNALGTCKHVLHVLAQVKRKFPAARLRRAYRRQRPSVSLHYGEDVSLRLCLPDDLAPKLAAIAQPLAGVRITRVDRLLAVMRELESAGQEVVVYPDAEEFLEQRLRLGCL